MPRKIPHIDVNYIIDRYNSGATIREIATELGVGCTTISRRLKSNGVVITDRRVIDLDVTEIVARYNSGESIKKLAEAYNVSRSVIRKRLENAGIVLRDVSTARELAVSRFTPEQRAEYVKPAHDAIRGKTYTHEEKCHRALSRQNSFNSFGSPYETAVADELTQRGVKFIPQFAIDIYNVDFAVGDYIALEVYGGGWHCTGRAAARFSDRSEKIFDTDRAIVICWFSMNTVANIPAIADYLIALDKILRSDPSSRRKHYVIGSNAKPSTIGSDKLNYIT